MTYQVIVQSRALRDIEEIFRWLADQLGPDAANTWYDELQAAIESLATFPNRCSLAPEAKSLKREVRQLMLGKRKEYRILFIVQKNRVAVVHIRHSRRSRLSSDDDFLSSMNEIVGPACAASRPTTGRERFSASTTWFE